MKKTFLFVAAQYLPTMGGVERYTYNLAKRLTDQGHRAIVLTSALKGLPAWELGADGIEIYRIPSWAFMNGRLPLLKMNREFFALAKKLWQEPIDHCFINTYFYPLSMYAASRASRRNIPAILINHGSAWLMTGSKILELAGQAYEHMASRLCHHYCPRFFGVSSAAGNWLRTFGITAQGTVTNAIDPSEVMIGAQNSTDWHQELDLPADAPMIAFVGRMIPEKGVDQMISAMESIRKFYPNAQLLMAGTGPLLEKYRNAAPAGVHLLGGQPYPKVLALLRQASLFCLPSRSEGFACTVLEAAALGCPILTTATGDSPQLLPSEEYGILLKDMAPDTIAGACIRALGDPAWQKNAATLTRERLLENYTWDTALEQLYQAFGLSTNKR